MICKTQESQILFYPDANRPPTHARTPGFKTPGLQTQDSVLLRNALKRFVTPPQSPQEAQHKRRQKSKLKPVIRPQNLDALLDDPISAHLGTQSSQRWLMPYADMLTLLLGLMLVWIAYSQSQSATLQQQLLESTTLAHQSQQALAIRESEMQTLNRKLEAQLRTALVPEAPETGDLDAATPQEESPQALSLNKDIAEAKASKAIQVTQADEGVVILMQDQVLFNPGEAIVTPDAKPKLEKLAKLIQESGKAIRVEGHTDNTPIHTPEFPSNWELSTARATAMARYLTEVMGLPPQKISAAGYGEFRPIAENSTEQGKRLNRRVAIVLLNAPSHDLKTNATRAEASESQPQTPSQAKTP
ncbi:MAG: flagellar motor protein MotB [Vampirovibrionales bacterium]|nr:flagellar motor protein MotB [Vampirovibrionales bacterium]